MQALTVQPGKANSLQLDDVAPPPESDGAVLVRAFGATYHTDLGDLYPDMVIECTSAAAVVRDVLGRTAPDGVVCLAGASSGGYKLSFDIGDLNRNMVLENHAEFGSVNATCRHYRAAAAALAKADSGWLSRLITRRVPIARWQEAFEQRDDDIKVMLDFE